MNSPSSNLGDAERSMSVGYSVIGATLVLAAIGYGLDRWLDTGPWLTIAGLLTGAAIALSLVRALMRSRRPS